MAECIALLVLYYELVVQRKLKEKVQEKRGRKWTKVTGCFGTGVGRVMCHVHFCGLPGGPGVQCPVSVKDEEENLRLAKSLIVKKTQKDELIASH